MSRSHRQDNQDPALYGQTPWQTVGPFFHYALPWKGGADLVGDSAIGARPDLMPADHDMLAMPRHKGPIPGVVIEIAGRVLDGKGLPVPDALIEIWQADAKGVYAAPGQDFIGFGRSATSEDGTYRFRTIRPGAVSGPDGRLHAPHIAVGVLGRGLLKRLVTRLYFAGARDNNVDPILALVPADRRDTLMATPDGGVWRFDLILQGERETVFFDC